MKQQDEYHQHCLYNFWKYMTWNRFRAIICCLRLTSCTTPTIVEWFLYGTPIWWPSLPLFGASALTRQCWSGIIWTCPGWVCCPCKPRPFWNEYHSAWCALLVIVFVLEIVCDKDHPKELSNPKYEDLSKTVGLLLWMVLSVFNTRRYIVLDSGFFFLKGLLSCVGTGYLAPPWSRSVAGPLRFLSMQWSTISSARSPYMLTQLKAQRWPRTTYWSSIRSGKYRSQSMSGGWWQPVAPFVLMTPGVRWAGESTAPHLSSNTRYPRTGTCATAPLSMTTTTCVTVFLH